MSVLTYVAKPIAYVSVPMYILSKLAEALPSARYYIRLGLFLSGIGICSVWGAICGVGMSLIGQRFNAPYMTARAFYALSRRLLGIRIVVEGEELLENRPAILISNHQSMLDLIMLGRVFPKCASILAKKELQWTPLLGQFMTAAGAIFVDRGNNARAVRSLTAAGETMRSRNQSIWIFPEGTRSMREHNDMLPFKKGAFHLAVNAQVPIIPIVVENYWNLFHKGTFESGVIKVKVLPAISTTGLTAQDVGPLSTRLRDLMLKTLEEISSAVPSSANTSDSKSAAPSTTPEQAQIPLATIPTPTESDPSSTPTNESRSESRASTYASDFPPGSPALSRFGGSENGVETEEDEGMVLVGRPQS